jgi:hypothetical protein
LTRNFVAPALTRLLLVACGSCAPKHAEPAQPKPSASEPSVANSTAPSASVLKSEPPAPRAAGSCSATQSPALSVATVTVFVDSWRQTQKKHDFAGYSALYAEHFSGLASDGVSVAKLNRSAWLRARAANLTLSPALATAKPHIALGAGGAQVTFGARSDAAPNARLPELFLIPTADGLRIAREAPARPAQRELATAAAVWLAEEPALSAVALARLPKALRGWLGHPVRVLGASGTVCETRLQRFLIRGQITPDPAIAEAWDGCADDVQSRAPSAIAQDIWRLSTREGRSLVAEFSTPCKGAILAVDPNAPAPAIAAAKFAPAELGSAALAALRELPAYARTQARFRAEFPDAEGAWEDHDGKRGVWLLELPSRPSLVFASIEAGAGCASFSASVSALWQVGGEGSALDLIFEPRAEDEKRLNPRAVVELGEAGSPALLLGPDGAYGSRILLAKTARGYEQRLLTSTAYFAGPC